MSEITGKTTRHSVRVKFPCWMNLFICSCEIFAIIFGVEPDRCKIKQLILKHTKSYVMMKGKWVLLEKDLR